MTALPPLLDPARAPPAPMELPALLPPEAGRAPVPAALSGVASVPGSQA
jgi:hypothetical protein